MSNNKENTRINKPNLLLIGGNGQNVGKTFLACKIIKHLSKKQDVIGIKVSPHFHRVEKGNILIKNEDFTIIEEDQITQKDSSLMWQAGAKKVYFAMASQKNLKKAFFYLNKLLPQKAIVCESGGLHEIINSGVFLFVIKSGDQITKKQLLKFSPKIIQNDGENFDFDICNLILKNNQFSILKNMDKFTQIQEQIVLLPPNLEIETVSLNNAFNRVLQENIYADTHMPPFDKSAMDGYACRLEDIGNELKILEVIHAGKIASHKIGKNQCSKIMTGAAVPAGADCVFKIEESEITGENKIKCTNIKTNKNICYLGEDYKANEVLIKKGTIINVSQMAVLAGAGYHRVKVSVQPKIALINTGSELVEPHEKPELGKIRNSNASQVISQLQKMNLQVNNFGIVEDDYDKLTQTFKKAFKENDFVIFTGGASVGDFDWVPKILSEQRFKIYWDKTGMKPGNPMTFSQMENRYCFGLSGNPVSSMVQFELIAKPVIYKLMGAKYQPLRIKAILDFDYSRKKADRLAIVPVVINESGLIERVPFNGSAHINALVFANAMIEIPTGINNLKKGDSVYVRPL